MDKHEMLDEKPLEKKDMVAFEYNGRLREGTVAKVDEANKQARIISGDVETLVDFENIQKITKPRQEREANNEIAFLGERLRLSGGIDQNR